VESIIEEGLYVAQERRRLIDENHMSTWQIILEPRIAAWLPAAEAAAARGDLGADAPGGGFCEGIRPVRVDGGGLTLVPERRWGYP
jgi:hypothetical protein